MGNNKDFLEIKGQRYQMEMKSSASIKNPNPEVGFSCLHYSVSESSGFIEIQISKKNNNDEFTYGVRTIPDSATKDINYDHYENIFSTKKG